MRLRNRQTKKNLRQELKETQRELAETKRKLQRVHKVKNEAYAQRNQLVSVLSRLFPAHLAKDSEQRNPRWQWVVFIELPTGQVSWHLDAYKDLSLFSHLEVGENNWDRHSTKTKYERLAALTAR